MEAVAGTAAAKIAPKILEFFASNHKLRAELRHDIEYINQEFLMICAAIQDEDNRQSRGDRGGSQVQKTWIEMVRGEAHAIEDCIDRFTHRVTLKTDAPWIRQKLHRVMTVSARSEFAAEIRRLKKIFKEAEGQKNRYVAYGHGDAGPSNINPGEFEEADTFMAVGIDVPLHDLLEQIREDSPYRLKVISLFGFGGIGKTHLARRVYDSPDVVGQYQAWAWVRAAERKPEVVLRDILQQITRTDGSEEGINKIRKSLKECLGTQRFFIVIDDMRDGFWHKIKDAFPVVPGVSSRIMVTTTLMSVAKNCSSAHGYAYMMRTLADKHSRQLFREASLDNTDQVLQKVGTSEALTKCDGLPLALVTTAEFLQNGVHLEKWEDLCQNLGKHLGTDNNTLARMKRVLVDSYTSLRSQQVKTCLLYMGIYPSGRPIRKGSLIRRWLAEGFIQGNHNQSAIKDAISNFNELVDRSIIRPIDASSSKDNTEVKECQTHGMMIEFILQKSASENFVTLLNDEAQHNSNIRWLSLHPRSAGRAIMDPKDLPIVRSLTVFCEAHNAMLDFSKYQLLRVLDLEECGNHLEEKHLKKICNLVLLRYLSLGASVTVTVLPKEIKKLQLLETLDVRRTNIEILPIQVIKLPCLTHLLGRFKLQHNAGGRKMRKLQKFLSNKSKLETVTGFVLDDKSQGFAQLVEHMKHLTKMKIWCKFTANASSNSSHLSEAIKGLTMRRTASKDSSLNSNKKKDSFMSTQVNSSQPKSLSLNFNDEWSHDMLMNLSLEEEKDSSYFLSSLKLQGGNICSLPPFVTVLGGLTKLCLSSPHLQLSSDILSSLSRMLCLEYLKLISTQLDKLVIEDGGFKILRHLCIVVEVMAEIDIQDGAFPVLESLRLLCKDQNGFCSTMIQTLLSLKEVALHDGMNENKKREWKAAANNHPRRPKILFVGSQSGVEIIPAETDTTDQEVGVGSQPAAEISLAAQPGVEIIPAETDTTDQEVGVGSQPAAEISLAAPSDIAAEDIAVEKEPDVETSHVAPPTDVTANEVVVESELVVNSSPMAAATDTTTKEVDVERVSMLTLPDAISTEESVQIDGDGQHDNNDDDDAAKEVMDNIKDPEDFSEKNGLRNHIYDTNMESSIEVIEGAKGLQDQKMEDGTQKRCLQNKQRLGARMWSLLSCGVFSRQNRQGRLVHQLD